MQLKKQDTFPYWDILYEKHHVSPHRAKMSMIERAAQFAPFAALTGYDAAIQETARLTGQRTELDASERATLDRKLQLLLPLLNQTPDVTVIHFVSDLRKEGGSYVTTTAGLKKIDFYRRCLVLQQEQVIFVDDILQLQCPLLPDPFL